LVIFKYSHTGFPFYVIYAFITKSILNTCFFSRMKQHRYSFG